MAGNPRASKQAERMLKNFGRRLRAARIVSGYEQATDDFAKELGVKGQTYRKYERGESWAPIEVLAKLSQITGKSLDFLLLGESDRQP